MKFSYQVVRFGREDFRLLCVPDNDVSIRSNSDSAFPRIQVEDFSSVCARYGNKIILVHFTSCL